MALESGAAPSAPMWHPAPRAAAACSSRWWRLLPVTQPQAGPVSPPSCGRRAASRAPGQPPGAGLGRRPEARGTAGCGEALAGMPQEKGLYISYTLSYEEQMWGWMAYLAQSRSVAQQVVAYGRLLQHLDNYRRIPVLAFDEAAAVVFQRLRRTRLRVGTIDLKIAAIVLSRDALLLSKNLTDFGQVPGLQIEDWTSRRFEQSHLRQLNVLAPGVREVRRGSRPGGSC